MDVVLKNDTVVASTRSFGAELTSLYRLDHRMEYLWQGDPAYWPRHAPILFPIVGRLANDTLRLGDRGYPMKQHGFARDREFHVAHRSDEGAMFRLMHDEQTLQQFPFRFELSVSYRLDRNTLHVRYTVANRDNREIYFSIGGHPAFNCPMTPALAMEDYCLEFDCEESADRHFLSEGLRNGQVQRALDRSRRLPLHPGLFDRDALIFKGLASSSTSLRSDRSPHAVSVRFDGFPYLGVWSKPGAPFVCIEPWHGVADRPGGGPFDRKEGVRSLAVGAVFECQYSIGVE